MATHREKEPERHPLEHALDEEVAAILAADPAFREQLREVREKVRRGEAKLIDDSEVRSRLRQRGVPLDEKPDA